MSSRSFPNIGLKPTQVRAAARRAEREGKTPSEYLRTLVEKDLLAAGGSFDQVLAPMRRAFARSGISEERLDQLVTKARVELKGSARRKGRR